jgi:hypothetical protein
MLPPLPPIFAQRIENQIAAFIVPGCVFDGGHRLRVDCDRLFPARNDAYHDAGRRFVWIARGFVIGA